MIILGVILLLLRLLTGISILWTIVIVRAVIGICGRACGGRTAALLVEGTAAGVSSFWRVPHRSQAFNDLRSSTSG